MMVQSAYSDLLARHAAMMLRILLIATLPLASAATSRAQTPPMNEAGAYIMLLDGDGRPVAGAYWLSPDLKIVVGTNRHRGLPSEPNYVDRAFMPQRRGVVAVFRNSRISYSPDPLAVSVGEEARIVRREELLGPLGGSAVRETPMKLTVTGRLAATVSGIKLIVRRYRIEKDDPNDKDANDGPWKGGPWGDRVYVETLDIDLSAEIAGLVKSVETGTALSSGDFYIRYMVKADVLPDLTQCLKEILAQETYEATALSQREGTDRMMATSFLRDGNAFWETGDDFPADSKAMNIYLLCK